MRLFIAFFTLFFSYAYAATLLPPGEQTFFDQNGNPLAAGTVTFYVPNTTTFKNTWKDSGQTILNTNPVVLDSSGRAIIYGSGVYRQIVKDSLGNTIWDRVTADTSSSTTSWGGTSGGSGNSQTVNAANFSSADGQFISFIAGFTNTSATTLNPSGAGPIPIVKDTATGAIALTGGEIVAGNAVSVVYDSTAGVFHLISYPQPTDVSTSSLTSTGIFRLTGIITPAALVANTDDWNPAGFSTSTVVRASASAPISLSGLIARSSGSVVEIQNVGANPITVLSNSASSLANNRFIIPYSISLQPSQSLLFWYDQTSGGWRLFHETRPFPVAGGYKNLIASASTNTQATITADALTVEDANGSAIRLQNINVTANITVSGANGLDTGIEAPSTWYSSWVIYNPTTNTIAALLSTSTTNPTLPAGYTYKARFSWVRNDGSSNFLQYVQKGNKARYIVGTNPVDPPVAASGVAALWTAVAWGSLAPPTTSRITVGSAVNATNEVILIAPNNTYGNVTSNDMAPYVRGDVPGSSMNFSVDIAPESSNIYWSSSAAANKLLFYGWEDNL